MMNKKLVMERLDRLEDEILNEVAEKRSKSFNRDEALNHEEIWENEE